MAELKLRLLGAPAVERDGMPVALERRKALALLAYLAVTGSPHRRDALAVLLWPERDQAEARAAFRHVLSSLNVSIGAGRLAIEGDTAALPASPGLMVDVQRFQQLLAQVSAHGHSPSRLCDECVHALVEAAELYRGDFLAGFTLADSAEFDDWQANQAEELRRELADALRKLVFAHAARGGYQLAIACARRWVTLDPLCEPAQRALIQAYAWSGDRLAALRQYDECVRVLDRELGVEPEPETAALRAILMEPEHGASEAFPAPMFAESHNLPPDPTPFIGREDEAALVADRLADPACRLLTLLGPGGIGKTRLAIQAARDQVERFEHGVYFVDLAPVTARELLTDAILRSLPDAPAGGSEPERQLLSHLAAKHALLVLDNFEQLQAGAGLLPRMLRAAPRLKLMATSRVRLNLREEWLFPLEGLALPPGEDAGGRAATPQVGPHAEVQGAQGFVLSDPAHSFPVAGEDGGDFRTPSDAALEVYGATALFLATLRRLLPGYRPSPRHEREIAHVCRLLEGMPLAIELAAAWARTVPLGEIARQVQHDLGLLATDLQDVPARHRSMTAAFDHSWRLLSASERAILRRSSVFVGGFTAAAAQAVCGASLGDLARLADASWLRAGADGRYGMHELIRQYCSEKQASERAAETPEGETADQVRDRHAAYFRSLVVAHQVDFFYGEAAVSTVSRELDNLSTAWEWCLASGDVETISAMSRGVAWVSGRVGWDHVWIQLLDSALRRFCAASGRDDWLLRKEQDEALLRANLLVEKARILFGLDELSGAAVCLGEAQALLDSDATENGRLAEVRFWLLRQLAWSKTGTGDFAAAAVLFRDCATVLREVGCQVWPYADAMQFYWQGEARAALAETAMGLSQWEIAGEWLSESEALFYRSGSEIGRAHAARLRIVWLISTGGYEEAERLARVGLQVARAFGDRVAAMECLWCLSCVHNRWGKPDRARPYCRQLLDAAREPGLTGFLMQALFHSTIAELGLGRAAEARRHCSQLLAQYATQDLARHSVGAIIQCTAGRVALALGDLREAEGYVRLALQSTVCPATDRAESIECMARLLLRQGEVERGVEALAFVAGWDSGLHCARRDANELLREIEAQLPPEVFAAAVARGRERQVHELVADLLA